VPGYPIRKPPDQSLVADSPRHIAGSHVLHRLLMPRHPPCALKNLNTQNDRTRTRSKPSPERKRKTSIKRCSRPLCSSQTTTSTTTPPPNRRAEKTARKPEETHTTTPTTPPARDRDRGRRARSLRTQQRARPPPHPNPPFPLQPSPRRRRVDGTCRATRDRDRLASAPPMSNPPGRRPLPMTSPGPPTPKGGRPGAP
jgi:hypothetical protein